MRGHVNTLVAAKGTYRFDAIKEQLGENVLKALIVKFLNSFLDFYNNARKDDEHRVEIVNLILSQYPNYSLHDLKFFFTQAKTGYYGDNYGRMDGPTIFVWLRKYDEERITDIVNMVPDRLLQDI